MQEALAERLAEYHVAWFEEPVSSDDLPGWR
jgi:L-alanine-DL-glutamate epimerase-like enolase superfamily enzyme